jgi:hypothetical protein
MLPLAALHCAPDVRCTGLAPCQAVPAAAVPHVMLFKGCAGWDVGVCSCCCYGSLQEGGRFSVVCASMFGYASADTSVHNQGGRKGKCYLLYLLACALQYRQLH